MPIVIDDPAAQYREALEVVSRLPADCAARRASLGLTTKQAAAAIGIGESTLTGFEAGSNCTKATLLAVLGWLAA